MDKAGERNKEQHINVRKFNVKRVNGNEIREKGDDFVERRANLTSLECEEIREIERRTNNTFYSNFNNKIVLSITLIMLSITELQRNPNFIIPAATQDFVYVRFDENYSK